MTYDDEDCPARGPGLSHTANTDAGPCLHCGRSVSRRPVETAPKPDPVEFAADTRIPPSYWDRYSRLRANGATDEQAQSLIAEMDGLKPAKEQKRSWTLRELNRLEGLWWLIRSRPPRDAEELGPR